MSETREFQLILIHGVQVIIAGIALLVSRGISSEESFRENAAEWHGFTRKFSEDVDTFASRYDK